MVCATTDASPNAAKPAHKLPNDSRLPATKTGPAKLKQVLLSQSPPDRPHKVPHPTILHYRFHMIDNW